jgi:hypothetical protein
MNSGRLFMKDATYSGLGRRTPRVRATPSDRPSFFFTFKLGHHPYFNRKKTSKEKPALDFGMVGKTRDAAAEGRELCGSHLALGEAGP